MITMTKMVVHVDLMFLARGNVKLSKKGSMALFLVILQGVVDNTLNPIINCKKQKSWCYS